MSGNADRERQRRVQLATGPLAVGALGIVLGVAAGLLGAAEMAAATTLAGTLLMLWGLHRLGRLGADPPTPDP